MQIQQKEENNKGSFYIEGKGGLLAEMTYSLTGKGLMIIDHTEVTDALRGKNIGYQLVKAAAAYARSDDIKVFPLCPFAKAVMEKKEDEFADVLHKK